MNALQTQKKKTTKAIPKEETLYLNEHLTDQSEINVPITKVKNIRVNTVFNSLKKDKRREE